MTLTAWIAIAVILVTVYCLIKRFETRLVLFTAGLFLCCIAMKPMAALDQFAKSMANASLIMAICSFKESSISLIAVTLKRTLTLKVSYRKFRIRVLAVSALSVSDTVNV